MKAFSACSRVQGALYARVQRRLMMAAGPRPLTYHRDGRRQWLWVGAKAVMLRNFTLSSSVFRQ